MIKQLQCTYSDVLSLWRSSSLLSESERNSAINSITNSQSFSLLSEKIRADKEIAFYAVHQFPWNILYLPVKLQIDYELLEVALIKSPNILYQLSDYIKKDKKFAKQLLLQELSIKQNNCNPLISPSSEQISYYSKLYQKPLASGAFQYFGRNVRNNKEIAEIALDIDFLNYSHIGHQLKENISFSIEALSKNHQIFSLLSNHLKKNQDICNLLLSLDGSFMNTISDELLNEQNILAAIKQNPQNAFLIPKKFYTNKHICLNAVSVNGIFLRELPYEMKNDFDISSAALFNTIHSLAFIGKSFEHLIEQYRYENQINTMDVSLWSSFPYFFYSKIKEKEMFQKLEAKHRFNFDDPSLNTIDDLTDEDDDTTGRNGGNGGNTKSFIKSIRKKI